MFKLLVINCLVLLVSFSTAANTQATLEQQIQTVLDDMSLAGISWATVDGQQIKSGSAGFANLKQQLPMNNSQKVHVGSVSKSVLAMGVLRMITTGELSLHTPIANLLPELAFNNPWRENAPITVEHLLAHTAGLENIRMWQMLSVTPTPNTPLIEAFKSRNTLLNIRTQPGSQYLYSNIGYQLLAMVIEAVTKQRYETYLDQALLKPLGMLDSTFHFLSQEGENADPRLAMGYHENAVPQPAVAIFLRAPGQFTTTAADMMKFMRFTMGEGKLNDQVFIRADLFSALSYPENTEAAKAGLTVGHGLALANRDRHGVIAECHPGSTFGFNANFCLFSKQKKGFFFAVNTDNETRYIERFNKLFINSLSVTSAPVAQPEIKSGALSSPSLAKSGLYFLAPNSMAEFSLVDRVFHFVWVSEAGTQLTLRSLQSADEALQAINQNLYKANERVTPSHVFYQNAQGDLMLSNGYKTYQQGSILELSFYWLSLLLGLIGLVYVLLVGFVRWIFWRQGALTLSPIVANLVLFVVPAVLYSTQSFLMFSEVTAASISLAILSGLLPFSLLFTLWLNYKSIDKTVWQRIDRVFILLALQLCILLLLAGQLPVIFWR
ncbi:methicillin resistance protein FmtA [Pseudoalteromonas phenolica]|uniref:Methicillin resistance protein FmtA n=1 Tax=Pseudoalteromonas phenolica TaxID=161398 RepID=A0A4Q7IQ75_9GAMM|nr:serine hydrolase domain-containing protein [Pseudoalteromonas phenolica]RZQ53616.1 methicillin resistance protein FmtA [Pseudoalteromonas phenolica]